MSRKTVAHLFSTLNGVVEAPNEWQFDAFGNEEEELMSRSIDGVDDVVIGRKLYQEWEPFWTGPGKEMEPFASFINGARKHVVSSTLGDDDLTWSSSTRVTGDPIAYLRDLREQEGGPITVTGGIDTIRSFFTAGLIDELILTTHPVVTNQGRRLFDESVDTTRLRLIEARPTSTGNVVLTYGLRQD